MSVQRAVKTDGWMEVSQLIWLNERAKGKKVVEVGSYKGRSTLALAEYAEFVIAVDNWEGPRECYLPEETRRTCYQEFINNLGDYIKTGRVIPLKINCKDLTVEMLPKEPLFDMVFIDGGHDYEAVSGDIKFWRPFIRKGGLLCGHDYVYISGVNQAVKELLQDLVIQEPIWNMWAVNL
jgi:predicted O-methyltransferase YrrM